MLRILHTSDWHIGRSLHGQKRYEEHEQFLDWLVAWLDSAAVDVVIIAGDVFDTTTPSNRAQALYYNFLRAAGEAGCRHIVVVGGNHDSPSLLNAPRELLRTMNIYVIGSISDNPADEVLLLGDAAGQPQLIVAAVPYLRDRDIRLAEAGESPEDKERKALEGIRDHYSEIGRRAEALRDSLAYPVPIVATGHLFAAGGEVNEGDGVRELYIGSLARVSASHFPACFDYLALGHLHAAQKVAGTSWIRYCGAPLAMDFGERRSAKQVLQVEFTEGQRSITEIAVPVFQELERISGDWDEIGATINTFKLQARAAWLEIIYTGSFQIPNLREQLENLIGDQAMKILRIRQQKAVGMAGLQVDQLRELSELSHEDVFERCLEQNQVAGAIREELRAAYGEIWTEMQEQDIQAE